MTDQILRRLERLERQLTLERKKNQALSELLISRLDIRMVEHRSIGSSIAPIEYFSSGNEPDGLVVAFGGMLTQLGMPAAEFSRTLTERNKAVVFVKDHYQAWYQKGLLGLTSDWNTTVSYLDKLLSGLLGCNKPKNMLGSSSGGFAAIGIACLLKVENVIAFGPQTIVGQSEIRRFGSQDTRLNEVMNGECLDILPIVSKSTHTNVHIHYCADNEIDKTAALRLSGLGNVILYEHPGDTHNVAQVLRQRGGLVDALGPLF